MNISADIARICRKLQPLFEYWATKELVPRSACAYCQFEYTPNDMIRHIEESHAGS